jgi:hypothetical protein
MPVVVSDGGSGEAFTTFLSRLPRITLVKPRAPHLVGQVQASMESARQTGARSILYLESDKQAFFEEDLVTFLRRAAAIADAGVVIAGRSPASFETFPLLQRFTERTINALCADVIGAPGDYSYGPFLLVPELVETLDPLPGEIGWGWRHFLFVSAHLNGRRVAHVAGDFPCPANQRDESDAERIHRLRQLAQNVNGLTLALNGARSGRSA